MRKALVDTDGNVVNIIVVDGAYTPPPGLTVEDVGGRSKEGRWNGKKFTPNPPAPVNPYEAVRALIPAVADVPTRDALTAIVNVLDPDHIPDETP